MKEGSNGNITNSTNCLISAVNPKIKKGFHKLSDELCKKSYALVVDDVCGVNWPYYEDSSHKYRQKSAATSNGFVGKFAKNPINCSKSIFVPTSRVNLPPAGSSTLAFGSSPQPLTVMGYRTDVFTNHQKQGQGKPSSKTSCSLLERSACTSSLNSLKLSPSKQSSVRWKAKPSTTARNNQYPDPLYQADTAYMRRISEMATLEIETIKYEKSKKFKRK